MAASGLKWMYGNDGNKAIARVKFGDNVFQGSPRP